MTKKKLKKLKFKIQALRCKICNIRYMELERVAISLGRNLTNQGKELTYKSDLLPTSRPLTIPKHPGALNKFTAGNILDQLEEDIFNLEEKLDNEGDNQE